MAEVWGVEPGSIILVRGALHAVALGLRRARLLGWRAARLPDDPDMAALARMEGLSPDARGPFQVLDLADLFERGGDPHGGGEDARFVLVDGRDGEIDPEWEARLAPRPGVAVVRDLSGLFGLSAAPCGALIADPSDRESFLAALEPEAVPVPLLRLAEAALAPARLPLIAQRQALIRLERDRMVEALTSQGIAARGGPGAWVFAALPEDAGALSALKRLGAPAGRRGPDAILPVGEPESNAVVLSAFGLAMPARPRRRAEVVRETRETKIAVAVDLEAEAPVRAQTGVGYFDHMLDQVASHGGFSLTLACQGDLEVDPHHTIEDCALALGAALKQALAERRGLARFGFVLPMDEALAQVAVDLGGRPYAQFDGAFRADRLGDYPTEMTAHVFRSLAESMGAAIHVRVVGDNDHHKTEACFKAFGRALRQALRVEGDAIPSTKGVL